MSTDMFNCCSELILRQLEKEIGLRVGGCNVTNIIYEDDAVLTSWDKKRYATVSCSMLLKKRVIGRYCL